MATQATPDYLSETLTDLSERKQNAEAFFFEHPEKREQSKLSKAYAEICVRHTFISDCIMIRSILVANSTNTDKAMEYCERLYQYAVSDWMYQTEEEKSKYTATQDQLQNMYPEWEAKIVYAIRVITETLEPGTSLTRYRRSLGYYVETIAKYFLWLRDMTAPLPGKREPAPAYA